MMTYDYNKNEHSNINDRFTLEKMQHIMEQVDQHSNAGVATTAHKYFKKTTCICYITRFKSSVENKHIKLEKSEQIKKIMLKKFRLKKDIAGKEFVHDTKQELYASRKAKELYTAIYLKDNKLQSHAHFDFRVWHNIGRKLGSVINESEMFTINVSY